MVEVGGFNRNQTGKPEVEIPQNVNVVETADGRKLSFAIYGDPQGSDVVLEHGSPGSRLGPVPRPIRLHLDKIKLIVPDRPGGGYSTRQPGRAVADAAEDVRTIADSLDIDTFAVVGRSGGGPHALACAALLPDRVTKVAALASPAPKEGRAWYEGMTDNNRRGFTDPASEEKVRQKIELVKRIQEDPRNLVREHLWEGLTEYDHEVIQDPYIWGLLLATYTEAVRQGAGGWIDDTIALDKPWGFELSDITVQTFLWHGAEDRFVPPSHAQRLHELIPHNTLQIEQEKSHFNSIEVLPDVLLWLIDK